MNAKQARAAGELRASKLNLAKPILDNFHLKVQNYPETFRAKAMEVEQCDVSRPIIQGSDYGIESLTGVARYVADVLNLEKYSLELKFSSRPCGTDEFGSAEYTHFLEMWATW